MNSPTLINARGQVIAQAEPALLSRVLGIASLGFLVTAAGVYFAPPFFSGPMLLVCVVASFALIFGVRATRANAVLSLSLFLGLAFVLGFEISPWMRMLIGSGHSNVIFNAAMTTGVGMGMLGIGRSSPTSTTAAWVASPRPPFSAWLPSAFFPCSSISSSPASTPC